MTEPKYDCVPDSIVGRLKISLLREQEQFFETKFDPTFVEYTKKNHGGIPQRQWIRTTKGRIVRIGRFLNFGGPYKKPFQENWLNPPEDLRSNWEIEMVSSDANFDQGCGGFLMPIALLYSEDFHPDGMVTKYLNAICFDFSKKGAGSVVYWDNSLALDEYDRCKKLGLDTYEGLKHANFTELIARSFGGFLRKMRLRKPKSR